MAASTDSAIELLHRRVGGDAGAGQRRGGGRVQAFGIDQVARMRHQQVGGKAALRAHAQRAHGVAQVVAIALAGPALAAAYPRVDQHAPALFDAPHLGAHRVHDADRLVPQRQRQLRAAIGELQLVSATQVEPAFADVHVGMAHAAVRESHQHLVGAGLRRVAQALLQGLAPFGDVVALHVKGLSAAGLGQAR
jgi:hypothetical protein